MKGVHMLTTSTVAFHSDDQETKAPILLHQGEVIFVCRVDNDSKPPPTERNQGIVDEGREFILSSAFADFWPVMRPGRAQRVAYCVTSWAIVKRPSGAHT